MAALLPVSAAFGRVIAQEQSIIAGKKQTAIKISFMFFIFIPFQRHKAHRRSKAETECRRVLGNDM
jgi:hypothetical protein